MTFSVIILLEDSIHAAALRLLLVMDIATTSAIAVASTPDEVIQPAAKEAYLYATDGSATTSSVLHAICRQEDAFEADAKKSKVATAALFPTWKDLNGQYQKTCLTWHFKYWCPYCELSYCCPVEKYVCQKIQTCKLKDVKHPQRHDAFRMVQEPHPEGRACHVMSYSSDGTVEDHYESLDSDCD